MNKIVFISLIGRFLIEYALVMYSSHQLSTMKVVYKSVEMPEDLQTYIEELAKSVCIWFVSKK